mmetsp:Transcript_51875/g.83790  ORF Transcript_51875/g.83790 Transcript_51875/m.83790 type:complete len:217 (-) Transcript_51875:2548-3198(-)
MCSTSRSLDVKGHSRRGSMVAHKRPRHNPTTSPRHHASTSSDAAWYQTSSHEGEHVSLYASSAVCIKACRPRSIKPETPPHQGPFYSHFMREHCTAERGGQRAQRPQAASHLRPHRHHRRLSWRRFPQDTQQRGATPGARPLSHRSLPAVQQSWCGTQQGPAHRRRCRHALQRCCGGLSPWRRQLRAMCRSRAQAIHAAAPAHLHAGTSGSWNRRA